MNGRCEDCAHYVPSGTWCLEWQKIMIPRDTCHSFSPADGTSTVGWRPMIHGDIQAGTVTDYRGSEPVSKAIRTREVTAVSEQKRREAFLRLVIDEGLSQADAAVQAGYAKGSGSKILREAVEAGRVAKAEHGRYEWVKPQGEDPTDNPAPIAPTGVPTVPEVAPATRGQVEAWVDERLGVVRGDLEGDIAHEIGVARKQLAEALRTSVSTATVGLTKRLGALETIVSGINEFDQDHAQVVHRVVERLDSLEREGEALKQTIAKLGQAIESLAHQVSDLRHQAMTHDRAINALEADVLDKGATGLRIGDFTYHGKIDGGTVADVLGALLATSTGGRSA